MKNPNQVLIKNIKYFLRTNAQFEWVKDIARPGGQYCSVYDQLLMKFSAYGFNPYLLSIKSNQYIILSGVCSRLLDIFDGGI